MAGRGVMAMALVLGVWSAGAGERGYGQLGGIIPPASQNGVPMGSQGKSSTRSGGDESPIARDSAEKMAQARNDDRQKRLVADTDKLLALATQLHEDVGKTNKNVLSMDVIKRAQEIEKLAHDVKERMKG